MLRALSLLLLSVAAAVSEETAVPPPGEALLAACRAGNSNEASSILASHPDAVNYVSRPVRPFPASQPCINQLYIYVQTGVTPLLTCSVLGSSELIQELLAAGAFPNAQDELGNTAMLVAAMKGRADVVQVLLDGRADPNTPRKVRIANACTSSCPLSDDNPTDTLMCTCV